MLCGSTESEPHQTKCQVDERATKNCTQWFRTTSFCCNPSNLAVLVVWEQRARMCHSVGQITLRKRRSAWVDHDKYVKNRSAPPRTLGPLIYSLGSYSEQGHAKVPSISFNFYLSTIPSKKIFCAQNFCFQQKISTWSSQLDSTCPNLTWPDLIWHFLNCLYPYWLDLTSPDLT